MGRKGKPMSGTGLYSCLSRVEGSSVLTGHTLTQTILRFFLLFSGAQYPYMADV